MPDMSQKKFFKLGEGVNPMGVIMKLQN